MAYKRLLVAIDLGSQSSQIALKAASMARTQQAEIHLLHIWNHFLCARVRNAARHLLTAGRNQPAIGDRDQRASQSLNIPVNHCHVAQAGLIKPFQALPMRLVLT